MNLFRSTCLAFAAWLGTGMGNFAAFAHTASPFQYDFGPAAEDARVTQDPRRNDVSPVNSSVGSIALSVDYAVSQQPDDQLGVYALPGVAFGYGLPVDFPLSQLSFRQLSEPVVPEPSTVLGGIAAAGLMLAFLAQRFWTSRRHAAPRT
ncbi:MAG TPA: hypothetical protein VIS96_02035 [Terrimicrobiaceae bacterium]